MKKARFAAGMLAAVLTFGAVTFPGTAWQESCSVSAASSLKAPTGFKTSCYKGNLEVTWDKVEGASAYKIAVKYPDSNEYKVMQTVLSPKADIPYMKNGDKISIKVTPLEKVGKNYRAGASAALAKTYKGEACYQTDTGLFVFDTSLLGKSRAQVSKALGKKKVKTESWQWWNDSDGDPVKIGYMSVNECPLAMIFDKDDKLLEVWIDQHLDLHDDPLLDEAALYYGNCEEFMERQSDSFFENFSVSDNVDLAFFVQWYHGEFGDICFRQDYHLSDRIER